jgi:hypothetical protein
VSRKAKTRIQRVAGSWYEADVVFRRDAKGNLLAGVGAARYNRRSWRYWRVWSKAVLVVLWHKLGRSRRG